MNEIQQVLKETEKDFYDYKYPNEKMRQKHIEQIEKEIEALERRKKRLEIGLDDYASY